MLSPKTKRNIARIIPFGLIWFISGLIFFVVEKAVLNGIDNQSSTSIDVNFQIFVFGTLASTGFGLLTGTIEVLYLSRAFAKKSFTKKLLYKTAFYLFLIFIITVITYPIAASLELNAHIFDERVWDKLSRFLVSLDHLSSDLQLAVTLGVALFYSEISENIGHGVLINFFTGKYHSPTEEKRIFMFLDMKSSTTIAEQLGHIRYFELLKEYYADMSDSIIQYEGEIYQYVGDEIIVSWKYKAGSDHSHCLRCFFSMKEVFKREASRYLEKYGLFPTFKAGFHFGDVTTGEIGELKKEIIFTGDVLNATARIQGLCNTYKVDLLISGQVLEILELAPEFRVRSLGKNELRGKTEEIELYTIENNIL